MQSAVSDIIAHNLAIVQKHMEGEAQDPASVMALYTDDVVLESPLRGLHLTDKAAIEANYLAMFGAMSDIEIVPLDRFATETRVVDDCIVRFSLSGEGFYRAPLPVGSRVELRLVHVFQMRDGLIARETVHEAWKALA
ncbi:MAG: nuclear transport factor 2 family protein [Rhodobacterales bacterium]|nr:nuclear transport factor 2 family protein [Rhodobacterales bacterium]